MIEALNTVSRRIFGTEYSALSAWNQETVRIALGSELTEAPSEPHVTPQNDPDLVRRLQAANFELLEENEALRIENEDLLDQLERYG